MSLRLISRTILAAALCAAPLHVALADDANTRPQPNLQAPGDFGGDGGDDRPGPPPPRNGGGDGNFGGGGGDFGGGGGNFGGGGGDFGGGGGNFGGGGGDFGGGGGGQGFGGGRQGGFGGGRGGGRRGMLGPAFMDFDEVRLNETLDQNRQRLLRPYLAILPTLSVAQQTHILAILDAASAELRAANADTTLPQDQRDSATRYLRSDLSNRIALALTPDQLAPFNAQLIRPNPQGGRGGFGQGGPGGFGQGGPGGFGQGGPGGFGQGEGGPGGFGQGQGGPGGFGGQGQGGPGGFGQGQDGPGGFGQGQGGGDFGGPGGNGGGGRGGQGFGGDGGGGGPRGGGFGDDGGGEGFDQTRARVLAGYEDVMDELSVKQKTDVLAILREADVQSAAVRANTQTTPAQKTAALRQIHDDVNTKVLPLLDADQVADWKKAHAAKRP